MCLTRRKLMGSQKCSASQVRAAQCIPKIQVLKWQIPRFSRGHSHSFAHSLLYDHTGGAIFWRETTCSHAIRHESWTQLNPISAVPQGAQRLAEPDLLTIEEVRILLLNPPDILHRTLVLLAAVTGFRRSEIRGLKWRDIDFARLWITPARGVVPSMHTKLKTRASRKGVPIPSALANVLPTWREHCLYNQDDWVFASAKSMGQKPIWIDTILAKYIKPTAVRAGITKNIGWRTFRHSLGSLLGRKKEDIKVAHRSSCDTLALPPL